MENAGLTADISATVRRFLDQHGGIAQARALTDATDPLLPSFDRPVWNRLAGELGVTAIAIPEDLGGIGLGVTTLAAVLAETGRELYPGPALSSSSATLALLVLRATQPSKEIDAWLEAIASGALRPALAVAPDHPTRPCGLELSTDGVLHGTALAVPDGADADLLIAVVSAADGRPALVVVELEDLTPDARLGLAGIDRSRGHADLVLDGVQAAVLCVDLDVIVRATDRAQILTAAEQVGLARGCLARTLENLAVREQFGRVIGSYQALQHRCADLAVAIETAAALVDVAASAADSGDELVVTQTALLARARASEVSVDAAVAMIQLHGGIGFTWEHPAHLYFRRAHTTATWFGGIDHLYQEAARRGCFALITRELAG